MARKFSNRSMQAVYDLRRTTPPDTRKTGLGAAYFRGLEHPEKRSGFLRTSLAYAAWAAGVDTAKEGI